MLNLKTKFAELMNYTNQLDNVNWLNPETYIKRTELCEEISNKINSLIISLLRDCSKITNYQIIHNANYINEKLLVLPIKIDDNQEFIINWQYNPLLNFSVLFYKNGLNTKPFDFELDWYFYLNGKKKTSISYSAKRPSNDNVTMATKIKLFIEKEVSII